MKKLVLVFIVLCLFISCEKDNIIIENTDIPLISEILIGDEIYMVYSYNSANLLTEEKSKFRYAKHTYNDINQLIASDFYWDMRIASSNSSVLEAAMNREDWVNPDNTKKDISHSFEYNSESQLIRKSYIHPSSNISDYQKFLYENGKIVRITGYSDNSISGYTDYIYDDNGNIIREMNYFVSQEGIDELTTTTEYEYDNMHNPFQSFKRLTTPGVFTNTNNITKETYTLNFDVDPSIEKVQITINTYEYNDRGYPVKVNGLTEYVYK